MGEAYGRQCMRKAIEAGQHCARPRRWLSKYGQLIPCAGGDAAALNKQYNELRKTIAAKVPKIKISAEWL